MRTYERTHPWLTFSLSLSRATYRLWVVLGEAQSKCEHISGVPLRPKTADDLHKLFLAKGALATTAIEGNTLSEEEVLQHLNGKLDLPPSKDYLTQEIDNIVLVCNRILEDLATDSDIDLTPERVKTFNRGVLQELTVAEGVVPGEVRSHSAVVARYVGAPAEDCEFLLQRLCDWLNSEDFVPPAGYEIIYGVLKATIAHLYLAWIHPFGDGNGRTARLMEFQLLVASGVPSAAAHLLSNHYNQTRAEYYRRLDSASKSPENVIPFLEYAAHGFVEGLRVQLQIIRSQQLDIAWRNYVDEWFRDKSRKGDIRRRDLVLDLSVLAEPVPVQGLKNISPRVATAYAAKSQKTLLRDVEALEKDELIVRSPEGALANRSIMAAFLPLRRTIPG